MTDKEIIKAVECCLSGKEELCKECPLNGKCYGDVDYLLESLDLINRQQEQLEAAIAGQETLQKALAEKDREVDDLKVENQSLRTAANCYKFHYNEARSEAVREFSKAVVDGIDEGYISHSSDIVDFTADYLRGKMVGDTE